MWRNLNVYDRIGFDKIIGQDLAKHVLIKAVREQEPSHAYLFLGLQGTGKTTTALEFAKALNCENPNGGNACGGCAICRAIEHGNFPDITVWSPDGQNTKIDQMREMREASHFKPMRGKWKVNIVEQSDTLNEDSASCILKLVEEPPDYLINILLYKNAATVLATIRSRCQLIRFTQVNIDELTQRLTEDHELDSHEAEFLATYSQGCPGVAIGLIDNDSFFSRRDTIIDIASKTTSGTPWAALKLAETLRSFEDSDNGKKKKSSRDMTLEALTMLLIWYRDLLAVKLQGDGAAVVNTDRRESITDQAAESHSGHLYNALEAILFAKRAIMGNGSPQIVTEALMMRLIASK